jgi:hypothetical protein
MNIRVCKPSSFSIAKQSNLPALEEKKPIWTKKPFLLFFERVCFLDSQEMNPYS